MQLFGLFVVLALYLKPGLAIVAYTPSSTYGIFIALAVPLELPHRNVFVSYNFEANYNSPADWGIFQIFQNGPIESIDEEEEVEVPESRKIIDDSLNGTQIGEVDKIQEASTQIPTIERHRRALLSRSNIYHILKDKFQRSGFPGEPCLLRLICETSSTELGEINGVLGSLLHVIFSPSTSEPEDLPLSYYQAEHDGWHDQCHHYEKHCGESLLELISEPFEEILKHIEQQNEK